MFKQINPDMLEGAIRNPIQQAEVVGRALRESVCSTDPNTIVRMGFLWVAIVFFFQLSLKLFFSSGSEIEYGPNYKQHPTCIEKSINPIIRIHRKPDS